MAETIQLWRCVECGKWSIAKDRPRKHRKLIQDPDAGRFATPQVYYCGPWEGWTATKDEP